MIISFVAPRSNEFVFGSLGPIILYRVGETLKVWLSAMLSDTFRPFRSLQQFYLVTFSLHAHGFNIAWNTFLKAQHVLQLIQPAWVFRFVFPVIADRFLCGNVFKLLKSPFTRSGVSYLFNICFSMQTDSVSYFPLIFSVVIDNSFWLSEIGN